jgi:TetR/AcrR family transcriptional regulator, cholesterol catabolism regulator
VSNAAIILSSRSVHVPRTARNGVGTADAIREAAVKLFYERGYQATTLREVAAAVGLQVGSLYNHIRSKDELLTNIMTSVMERLNDAMDSALAEADADAVSRLRAAMSYHIRYHAEHAPVVFIGNSELRSLSPPDRKKVTAARRSYEDRLYQLVVAVGDETGADVLDPRLQTYALLALGVHVSTWYRPTGPLKLDEIVETYVTMATRQLGIPAMASTTRSSGRNRRK